MSMSMTVMTNNFDWNRLCISWQWLINPSKRVPTTLADRCRSRGVGTIPLVCPRYNAFPFLQCIVNSSQSTSCSWLDLVSISTLRYIWFGEASTIRFVVIVLFEWHFQTFVSFCWDFWLWRLRSFELFFAAAKQIWRPFFPWKSRITPVRKYINPSAEFYLCLAMPVF